MANRKKQYSPSRGRRADVRRRSGDVVIPKGTPIDDVMSLAAERYALAMGKQEAEEKLKELTNQRQQLSAQLKDIDAREIPVTFDLSKGTAQTTPEVADIMEERSALLGAIAGIDAQIPRLRQKVREGFATLADEFRASLTDTKRMGYPLEVLVPEVRRRADDACRALIPLLHRSHRMVLDADFTRLAAEIARQPASVLMRYFDVARMPFSHLWLEWPQEERQTSVVARNYQKDSDIPDRVGLLIYPMTDTISQAICVSGYYNTCAPSPVGMVFSLVEEIDRERLEGHIDYDQAMGDYAEQQKFIDECPIGFNWMDFIREHAPEELPIAAELAQFARINLARPFGPMHREIIINALLAKEEELSRRQQEWLGLTAREINGLWRFIIAVLGLLNTGGGEFVIGETRRQPRRAFRSGTLPAYEYRVLKLARPTRPEIVQQKLPPGPGTGQGRRQHTVPGSWHHRRTKTAECARHPKVCPIAVWHKKLDPETGDGVGSDQYECGICHRLRWFLPEHKRGNVKHGIVDKGYQIVSSMDDKKVRPSHKTIEVVERESLPPNVRLKSIPRFDVIPQKDETDGRKHHD